MGGGASEPRSARDLLLSSLTLKTFLYPFRQLIHNQGNQKKGGRSQYYEDNDKDGIRLNNYCAYHALHVTSARMATAMK